MELYGLIGERLSHSLSPRIHARILDALGIEGVYALFEVEPERVGGAVTALRTLGVRGANVTIPYKQALMAQVDALAPEARAIGAINTIAFEDGRAIGHNTDYHGFERTLEYMGIDVVGKTVAVLGDGGSARAACRVLEDKGVAALYRVSRRPERAPDELIGYEALEVLEGDLLVNTTPVGMYPNAGTSPVGEAVIARFHALIDLIYNPRRTEFLRIGARMGKPVCDGLYMLVMQAVRSQEIWQRRQIAPSEALDIFRRLEEALA